KPAALLGCKQQPLAPVALAGPLRDPASIDQLFEHSRKTLLGNLQDLQEIGNAQARVAIDKMQYAVMGAAQPELRQDGICLTGEVAIGKKQQLNEGEKMGIGRLRGEPCPRLGQAGRALPAYELRVYVSHVDLFGPDC